VAIGKDGRVLNPEGNEILPLFKHAVIACLLFMRSKVTESLATSRYLLELDEGRGQHLSLKHIPHRSNELAGLHETLFEPIWASIR
jgi:hypothetical protein